MPPVEVCAYHVSSLRMTVEMPCGRSEKDMNVGSISTQEDGTLPLRTSWPSRSRNRCRLDRQERLETVDSPYHDMVQRRYIEPCLSWHELNYPRRERLSEKMQHMQQRPQSCFRGGMKDGEFIFRMAGRSGRKRPGLRFSPSSVLEVQSRPGSGRLRSQSFDFSVKLMNSDPQKGRTGPAKE